MRDGLAEEKWVDRTEGVAVGVGQEKGFVATMAVVVKKISNAAGQEEPHSLAAREIPTAGKITGNPELYLALKKALALCHTVDQYQMRISRRPTAAV